MAMTVRGRDIIADSPWFEDLPESALDTLAAAAEVRSMPANSYVYEQGLPSTEVCCILTGRVRVSISSPNGQEFALVDHEPGTWLGQPSLVGDEGRVIDARVIEPSEMLFIPRDVVLAVGQQHPLLYRNLFLYTQNVLRGFHELMAGILFYPLHSRVAGRLLALAAEHGEKVDDGILLDIKVSQNDFARLALGSRQRVNKIFREWTARGLVDVRDDRLLIRDIQGLEQEIKLFE
jgi:CRP-like cAMP-binding protein